MLFGTDTARADSSSETATRTTTFEKFAFGLTLEPPVLELDRPAVAVAANRPAIVTGTTDPHGRIQVAGTTLEADSRGIFAFVVERPGEGPVEVTATNALGVSTSAAITLRTVPSRVELDAYRAVHIGFCGWSNPEIRNRILTMADEGRINAVQLDIKDEAGHVGYGSRVELARTIGATSGGCRIDLDDAVRTLHSRGIAVIGRVVAFADPLLAAWAWDEGHRDWVIQDVNGGMYRGHYSGFTNFAHLGVIAYNLEIAEEAARSGVDHILWDYIRRPEGRVSTLVFPGLEGTAEDG
ncbi:MAG: putative glycoside hydrolase, partial [Nitriliruptoraceae bacterium]